MVASTPAAVETTLRQAATGVFPPDDGTVHVVAAPVGAVHGVIAFSAQFFVCAPVALEWVAARVDTDDFTATHGPAFLTALAAQVGADIGALDVVLAGSRDDQSDRALARVRHAGLTACDDADHPRVVRARRYRSDLRVWQVGAVDSWVIVGRGICGRWEASFEVAVAERGRGLGCDLAAASRSLVPTGEPTFVQVSPGNVASLRAVLAAGFSPVGSEVLLPPHRPDLPL